MISIQAEIHIDRPIEEVWAYITDPAHEPVWQTGLTEAQIDGPLQVGARMTRVGSFLGIRTETVSEVVVLEPPNRRDERTVSGNMEFEITTQLAEMNGGTHLTADGNFEVGGLFKIAEGALASQARKQTEESFERLKGILEG